MTSHAMRIFSQKLFKQHKAVGSLCSYTTKVKTLSPIVTVEGKEILQSTGAIVHQNPDYFGVKDMFTVPELFEAKVHLGHVKTNLHPSMKQFIFGNRLGHLIIDLDQTAELLYEALNFTSYIAYNGGVILFIGRNPQATHMIEETAMMCKEYCHTKEWRQNSFLSSDSVYNNDIRLPDLCIFLSTLDGTLLEHGAVAEAAKMCIPTVGIVDTNCNRNLITYPIPGNDDSMSSISLYCSLFKQVILKAKEARQNLELKDDIAENE